MDNGESSYRRFLSGDKDGLAEVMIIYRDGYGRNICKTLCQKAQIQRKKLIQNMALLYCQIYGNRLHEKTFFRYSDFSGQR